MHYFKENNFKALCMSTFLLTWFLWYNIPSTFKLPELSSAVTLVYRELAIPTYSHRGIASKSQEKGKNCRRIEILQNEDNRVI